jgi:trigger factor
VRFVSLTAALMATDISTTTTELPESRVRVEAEVGPGEVERRVTQAAKALARNIRVPGFRAGKAPPPIVIKRVGREAVLDEAVRESLAGWYRAAIDDAHVVPVGDPEVDLGDLPKEGEPLKFSIEIGVRPKATLGDYKDLEVPKRDAAVPDSAVDDEVDRLRERAAKLETVDRQAQRGDFVVMDFAGSVDGTPFPGGEGRDQMIELGSGRLVPGFEDQLEGAVGGEERTVTITFPDDYGAPELAGKDAEFAVTVREVKAKQLPELDDEFAEEAGFDTLAELREDIRTRMATEDESRLEMEFREAALDAAVANATLEVPDTLIEARAREMWESMLHTLAHQGINRETYLRLSGRSEEETIESSKPDAETALRREAVLAAVAEAESLEPSEEEMLEAVSEAAPGERVSPKKLLERLKSNGRLDSLKDDLAQRKALDVVAGSAKPVPAAPSDS